MEQNETIESLNVEEVTNAGQAQPTDLNEPEVETPEQAPEPETPDAEKEETESDNQELDEENKSLEELPLPEENKSKKELPKYAKKKLEKKERELQAKEAEIALLRQQIEQRQQQGHPTQSSFNPNIAPPKREDFQNEDDYIDARFEYKQKLEQIKHQTVSQQQAAINAEMAFTKKLKEAQDAGSENYEDFEEVIQPLFSPGFPGNRAMAEAIVDSPHNHDILYFLGKYPEKAREIALLNPVQAVKRIAEIETRFQARKAQAQTSKAPAPIASIKTNNASPLLDIEKVAKTGSQRDFEAMVNKLNSQKVNPWG